MVLRILCLGLTKTSRLNVGHNAVHMCNYWVTNNTSRVSNVYLRKQWRNILCLYTGLWLIRPACCHQTEAKEKFRAAAMLFYVLKHCSKTGVPFKDQLPYIIWNRKMFPKPQNFSSPFRNLIAKGTELKLRREVGL